MTETANDTRTQKPSTVPAELLELAGRHYSMHGNGLTYNLLAAVLPAHERMIRDQVAKEILTNTDPTPWEAARSGAADAWIDSRDCTKAYRIARGDLHREYRIYDACGHIHTEFDDHVRDIADVGLVCDEGYLYSVCRHCCTDANGDQTEECASAHDHSQWLCPTRHAIEEQREAKTNA